MSIKPRKDVKYRVSADFGMRRYKRGMATNAMPSATVRNALTRGRTMPEGLRARGAPGLHFANGARSTLTYSFLPLGRSAFLRGVLRR